MTGVQTCALPIWPSHASVRSEWCHLHYYYSYRSDTSSSSPFPISSSSFLLYFFFSTSFLIHYVDYLSVPNYLQMIWITKLNLSPRIVRISHNHFFSLLFSFHPYGIDSHWPYTWSGDPHRAASGVQREEEVHPSAGWRTGHRLPRPTCTVTSSSIDQLKSMWWAD